MENKTNAMRLLDKCKIPYRSYFYDSTLSLGGMQVAKLLGEELEKVFKTLVTVGESKAHYVFMLPVNKGLDLKKAAKCVGEKSVAMIKEKELFALTGYVHGGCSPLCMKKQFRTLIDISAVDKQSIFFSAGKIGAQVETTLDGMKTAISFNLADLTE